MRRGVATGGGGGSAVGAIAAAARRPHTGLAAARGASAVPGDVPMCGGKVCGCRTPGDGSGRGTDDAAAGAAAVHGGGSGSPRAVPDGGPASAPSLYARAELLLGAPDAVPDAVAEALACLRVAAGHGLVPAALLLARTLAHGAGGHGGGGSAEALQVCEGARGMADGALAAR